MAMNDGKTPYYATVDDLHKAVTDRKTAFTEALATKPIHAMYLPEGRNFKGRETIEVSTVVLGFFSLIGNIFGLFIVGENISSGGILADISLWLCCFAVPVGLFSLSLYFSPRVHPSVERYLNKYGSEIRALTEELDDFEQGVRELHVVQGKSEHCDDLLKAFCARYDELCARIDTVINPLEELVAPIRDRKTLERLKTRIGRILPDAGATTQDLSPYVAICEADNALSEIQFRIEEEYLEANDEPPSRRRA